MTLKTLCLTLLAASWAGSAAHAQSVPAFQTRCESSPENQRQKTYCEIRDLTLPAPPAGTPLTVDARLNGSITVRGWSGATVLVRARVQGQSGTLEAARALAAAVKISTAGYTLRAARANAATEGWAVSYEVLVPTRTSLALTATNGGLRLENVEGTIAFETVNGSVDLVGLAGDVRGKTTNGSLSVVLAGTAWDGAGLDAKTTNGSVTCGVPAQYAGILVARTVHGRVTAALAPEVRKLLQPHNLTATFGKGGAQLRLATVNGSVSVQQAGASLRKDPQPEPAE